MIFVAFFELIGGALLLLLLAGVRRGVQSASSWRRTTACIKTFGMTAGAPSVVYDYKVDGASFSSSAIVPGAFFFRKNGAVKAPKALCVNPDGSLKFAPGSQVDVFYNPRNPADAVLVPGVQVGEVIKQALIGLMLTGVPLIGWENRNWMSLHQQSVIPGFFFLVGAVCGGVTLFFLRRCLLTRNYPFVMGRLLNASVAYCGDSEGSGYMPTVDYEYTVSGQCFQSQQLSAIPVRVMTSKNAAQVKVDGLLAMPEVKVYYNPRAPWEAFLRPGPYWGLAIPLAIGTGFAIFGLFFMNHH
ncbi:MAG: DUF3592 domain-containing protein [Chthoniobacteraceae bacterium]